MSPGPSPFRGLRGWVVGFVLVASAAQVAGSAATPADPCAGLTQRIPGRPGDASAGSQFVNSTTEMSAAQREEAELAQLLDGNLPAFLRRLKPVRLEGVAPSGARLTATICVMPDYLAIGSEADFVRVPLTLPAATEVARTFGFVLPTRKIVDAIHRQSAFQFSPSPMTPGPEITSSGYYLTHNAWIRSQRNVEHVALGALVSGHKKDVVLTNRLHRKKGRIAIYGWHRRTGEPIQPLSTVHAARYADYSHGVRLIGETVWIGNQPRSIYDVLSDPKLAPVLSREGVIREVRTLMGAQELTAGT